MTLQHIERWTVIILCAAGLDSIDLCHLTAVKAENKKSLIYFLLPYTQRGGLRRCCVFYSLNFVQRLRKNPRFDQNTKCDRLDAQLQAPRMLFVPRSLCGNLIFVGPTQIELSGQCEREPKQWDHRLPAKG